MPINQLQYTVHTNSVKYFKVSGSFRFHFAIFILNTIQRWRRGGDFGVCPLWPDFFVFFSGFSPHLITQDSPQLDFYLHRHNHVFKDVYREVGILEVFVGSLVKYSGFLQKHVNVESDPYDLELTNEDEIENGNDLSQNSGKYLN